MHDKGEYWPIVDIPDLLGRIVYYIESYREESGGLQVIEMTN